MNFEKDLQPARLIRRYKRFLADVELEDGSTITLHCPNTGSMKNCLYPGKKVWFLDSENPKRKYPCTWELAEIPVTFGSEEKNTLAGLNTGRANKLVEEALVLKKISELAEYDEVRREVPYGEEKSRIDFLLQQQGLPDCYVEVKSVTLAIGDGLGLFPDSVTTRGTKHLRELIAMVESGHRAVLLFCVQHTGIERVAPAHEIDPKYGQAIKEAAMAGVEILALGAEISTDEITLTRTLPVLDID
ncbi:DNA/RNA nuclease SfsA [Endozoicomonas numazuensis]|uniref:Sugar fermentation stimulation protein homolog n=1 Tax=Endozoicomonas numazuensis TaxID=1137799 RepID=A0A081ND99_9GAMM|nr:DNA/RNA nuclease SfsA [Endozoicomonas numazuensis]KEQ16422.1 XRE family transcriptional regulator [Endozoicomonas numazuensis]